MSGALQGTHNLTQCSITIDGIPLTGAADGDFVTVEYNSPIYLPATVGADGDYHRATSNDRGGNVTFRIMQTSTAARAFLGGINRRHELGLAETHTINITSLQTGETIFVKDAWPTDRPTLSFGQDVGEREYAYAAPLIQEVS